MRDVLFVHGMFMNPKSWAPWVDRFTAAGARCHTVAWPGHDGEPAELRKSPPDVLTRLTLGDVVQTHREAIAALPAPPVVIGHSIGGLVAQRLLNEGLVAAAVAIDPAPPRGIFALSWSFLKANLPVANPLAGSRPFQFTLEQFHYAFCNTLTIEQTKPIYDAFVVPESRWVARSAAGADGAVDFARPHAPLLIVGGERDNIVPAVLNEKNFRAYTDPASTRELKVFPGRDHFLCGNTGWEEIAAFVEGWLAAKVPGWEAPAGAASAVGTA